jgi:hypothetical protein
LWAASKSLGIALDRKIKTLQDTPYTISYVIRKRMQIDSFNELPSEKKPPEYLIWLGNSDEIEQWLDRIVSGKEQPNIELMIDENEVE